jgi:hypothetical protein
MMAKPCPTPEPEEEEPSSMKVQAGRSEGPLSEVNKDKDVSNY